MRHTAMMRADGASLAFNQRQQSLTLSVTVLPRKVNIMVPMNSTIRLTRKVLLVMAWESL